MDLTIIDWLILRYCTYLLARYVCLTLNVHLIRYIRNVYLPQHVFHAPLMNAIIEEFGGIRDECMLLLLTLFVAYFLHTKLQN